MDLERPARRRRGTELENALLDAAWDQLSEAGYASFTIEAVAERAGTSKPVVYRRWSDKHDLLRATVRHVSDRTIRPAPDTGSLRGDVIAQLVQASRDRLNLAAVLMVHLGGYFAESGTSPADLRELLLGGSHSRTAEALDRAVARGEVDPDRLTPRIIDLPFALFRHEAMMTLKPVPEEVAAEIVDTIFLPLVCPLS
jgi:AcrR family transcriptional regulator